MVVCAEYNHSVPPALKNLLDHFGPAEFAFKPSGIVTYSTGPFGGVRAGIHLREILADLGTTSIPAAFPISQVQTSFDEKGTALNASYNQKVSLFLDSLEWYAAALKDARATGTPSEALK